MVTNARASLVQPTQVTGLQPGVGWAGFDSPSAGIPPFACPGSWPLPGHVSDSPSSQREVVSEAESRGERGPAGFSATGPGRKDQRRTGWIFSA